MKLWALAFFSVFLLATGECFYLFQPYIYEYSPQELGYLIRKVLYRVYNSSILIFPVILYWYFSDRGKMPVYGLSSKNAGLQVYFWLFLLMIPLVGYASFQEDFLKTYPSYRVSGAETYLGVSPLVTFSFFEIIYALDFISVEFFFRGFLILAFARFLGTGAIIPMAALYCVFHFGKPMGEAISSFFGGCILGVLAFYTRSIFGGIFIHMGIALLMEIFAIAQHIKLGTIKF